MIDPETNETETDTNETPAVAVERGPAPKKVTKTTAKAEKPPKAPKEPKPPKAPKEPKPPKPEWKPSDELATALAVIKAHAACGDSKSCAFAVKEAIAARELCKAVRDSGANIGEKAD